MQASDLGFLWKGTAISRGSSAVSKEYVAGRCPLVACQIPHYSDLWRGIEFVSPDIDIDDFCQKVIETLDDDKKLQSLRQEQEWNYENINYQKIGQWHMRLYNELLERK
jgi:glycosyltransferase involved in cell wall biosynthesis